MKGIQWKSLLLAGALTLFLLVAACGGAGSANPPSTESPAPAAPATPTPEATPTPATVSTDPGPMGGNLSSEDLLARGEKLFQETAGGVGCAYCHGQDARGDVGPNIVGKSQEAIGNALGLVEMMSFIQQTTPLNEEDIEALAAYLKHLEQQHSRQ